jgi:hypothetical protein
MSLNIPYDLPERLTELIASLFTLDELAQLGEFWPAGRPLAQFLALGGPDTGARIAREVLGSGRVDEFLLLLQEKRPLRRDEIDAMQRRWQAHCRSIGNDPPEPLPLSAEMERIQQYAEGDDALDHQETTALHLLHALLAVQAGYTAQARLCQLIPPSHLLRTLRSLARVSATEIPEGARVVRQGYARLWAQADALAQRRSGVKLQYPDMLLAFCALRSADVGEYLKSIGVTWAQFDSNVPKPTSQVIQPEALEPPAAPPPAMPALPALQLAHYQDVYGRFVMLKRMHGEDLADFTLDKFVHMLHSKTTELMKQPDILEVEFVPYVKQGKPALRANFRRRDNPQQMMSAE